MSAQVGYEKRDSSKKSKPGPVYMKLLKLCPLYVILGIVAAPLFLYSVNQSYTKLSDILVALVPFIIAGILLFQAVQALVRVECQAALLSFTIIALVWVVWFIESNAVYLLCPAVLVLVWRFRVKLSVQANVFLTPTLVLFVVLSAGRIAYYKLAHGDGEHIISSDQSLFHAMKLGAKEGVKLPSIVHIVVDGYGSQEVFRRHYGVDNAPFIEKLKSLGFSVFNNARTPYNQTLFAMASVFAGAYVEKAKLPKKDPRAARIFLGESVTQGPFKRILIGQGYEFFITDSGYEFFPVYDHDELVTSGPKKTILEEFVRTVVVDNAALRLVEDIKMGGKRGQRVSSISYSDKLLKGILEDRRFYRRGRPFFAYVHLLAPHPPFTVDRDGNPTKKWPRFSAAADASHVTFSDPVKMAEYREGYLEKKRFLDSQLIPQLSDMIQSIPSPKIIIVHGDHGPGSGLAHNVKANSCLHERFSPLLAVYTDESRLAEALRKESTTSESVFNLVNLYRFIFRSYYSLDIEMLPNRTYFVPWNEPYLWTETGEQEITKRCNNIPDL